MIIKNSIIINALIRVIITCYLSLIRVIFTLSIYDLKDIIFMVLSLRIREKQELGLLFGILKVMFWQLCQSEFLTLPLQLPLSYWHQENQPCLSKKWVLVALSSKVIMKLLSKFLIGVINLHFAFDHFIKGTLFFVNFC